MKKVWARIGMSLNISDEEAEQLLKEAGCNDSGQNFEYNINEDFARRFVKNGKVDGDSYIPETVSLTFKRATILKNWDI